MIYLYNKGSHTLHLVKGCKDAKGVGLLEFFSEDAALAYAGRSLRVCKLCAEKRDEAYREWLARQHETKKS